MLDAPVLVILIYSVCCSNAATIHQRTFVPSPGQFVFSLTRILPLLIRTVLCACVCGYCLFALKMACTLLLSLQVVTELSSRLCSLCREATNGFFVLTCSRVCRSCFETDKLVKMCSLRYARCEARCGGNSGYISRLSRYPTFLPRPRFGLARFLGMHRSLT